MLDQRGHGASDWGGGPRLGPATDDLLFVIDQLGPIHALVGHSYGGARGPRSGPSRHIHADPAACGVRTTAVLAVRTDHRPRPPRPDLGSSGDRRLRRCASVCTSSPRSAACREPTATRWPRTRCSRPAFADLVIQAPSIATCLDTCRPLDSPSPITRSTYRPSCSSAATASTSRSARRSPRCTDQSRKPESRSSTAKHTWRSCSPHTSSPMHSATCCEPRGLAVDPLVVAGIRGRAGCDAAHGAPAVRAGTQRPPVVRGDTGPECVRSLLPHGGRATVGRDARSVGSRPGLCVGRCSRATTVGRGEPVVGSRRPSCRDHR